jgi:hypothetical protein
LVIVLSGSLVVPSRKVYQRGLSRLLHIAFIGNDYISDIITLLPGDPFVRRGRACSDYDPPR